MKRCIIGAILISLTLALQSCKRRVPKETPGPTDAKSGAGAEMVGIAGGVFMMGDKDEVDAEPHEVSVSPFQMDKHLVTQGQYQRVMKDNPSRWKVENHPVEQVRWSDAVRYCNARSQAEGLKPGCPPRPNGNMPAEPERKQRISSAIASQN